MAYAKGSLFHGGCGETQRRSTLILISMLLTLAAAYCNLVPARANQTAPPLSTRLSCTRTVNGQLLLPVKLTGAKGQIVDANFILDTGVNKCCISDAMATRLGLRSEAGIGDDGISIVFNGSVAHLARIPLLELGSIPCGPVACVIFGAEALSATTGQTVDGVLGNNLLKALPALINPQSKEVMFFYPGPVTADKLRAVGMADATAVPLNDLDNNLTYACMTRIGTGDKSLQKNLVLDIGSATTMINGSDARKLGLSTEGNPASSLMILTGPLKVLKGKTTTITLEAGTMAQRLTQAGNMTVKDVMVAYPKGDLPDFLPAHLGRDVLDHYLLLMDYAEKKMYVKPISGLGTPAFVPKITIGGK